MRQVFHGYDTSNQDPTRGHRYCPAFGAGLEQTDNAGRGRPRCPECGWVHHSNPFPGVAVLVHDGGRILIGRRRKGGFGQDRWCLPGGFIEFEEDFLTAAKREVEEETGLLVAIESVVNVTCNYLGPRLHTLAVVLLAHVTGGTPAAGDDIVELSWLSPGDPLPDMAFEADACIIARYHEGNLVGLPVDQHYA